MVKNDHILNLLQEVEGRLPGDKERMTAPIREFLALSPEDRMLYIAGRRTGIFSRLTDMEHPGLRHHAEKAMETHQVTLDNVEAFAAEMMTRFI